MGVDIATYRGRIGTFKHAFGQNVVTQDVLVDVPSFRRIIIWEMLCVLLIILYLLETSFVLKYPNEFKNTIHGWTWDHLHVADSLMPLTLHFVLEVIGYSMLLTAVLPELCYTHTGIPISFGSDVSKKDISNDSKRTVPKNLLTAKTTDIACVVGSLSIIGMLLLMAGVEPNPGPNGAGTKTCERNRRETENHLFERLDLARYFPGKITLFDVISITQEDSVSLEGRKENKLPWILLRKLMSVDENAFCLDDPTEIQDSDISMLDELSSDDEEDGSDMHRQSEAKLNYLDVFLLVYQCCSPKLQQTLIEKMFLCKFAVPFLITSLTNDHPILSIWPLRSIVVETSIYDNSISEYNVLDIPTRCIAFCRIGRPLFSKSILLNSLVSDKSSKSFFNKTCQSGDVLKSVCTSYIETFWLLRAGNIDDKFDDATMVLNMRGSLGSFDEQTKQLVCRFCDAITLFIQKAELISYKTDLQNICSLFTKVIIVIVGSSRKKVATFVKDLLSDAQKNECTVCIVETYSVQSKTEKEIEKISNEIVKSIKALAQNQEVKSFKTRYKECAEVPICTDEQGKACKVGKTYAREFCKFVNLKVEFLSLRKKVTPIQSVARTLVKLLKEFNREKDSIEAKIAEIKTIRQNMNKQITEPIKYFLKILSDCISLEEIRYFVAWLEFYISRSGRHHLSKLKVRHQEAWKKFHEQKDRQQNVDDARCALTVVESEMEESSFSVGHLFREIGLIYDNMYNLNLVESELNIPSVDRVASIIGNLTANGRELELIDGDSFYLPQKWLSKIFVSLDKDICYSNVLTISVLGIQSSGKSTLLNTMFGSVFATSAGRCTRGIHAQLIPLHTDVAARAGNKYQYILILDTVGLRPSELLHESHEHDNEVATLITGLGNTTIVNVMGENTNEIRDILQIVAHAFLRIKLANKAITLKNRCILVQQNITAITAKDKMNEGLNSFIANLDEMAHDSARCEGVEGIRTFNQVINFDVTSDVWYLTNVWHGNPPFARINRKYTENANKTKFHILKQVSEVHKSHFITLKRFIVQANDLWEGVLHENFVFSFKNSLERKAYLSLDEFIQENLWKIERFVTMKTCTIAKEQLSGCDTIEKLKYCETVIGEKIKQIIDDELTEAEILLREHFSKSDDRHIIIQWEENQKGRLKRFFDEITDICKVTVRTKIQNMKWNIQFVSNKKTQEEALHKKTLEYAETKPVKSMSKDEVKSLFEEFWTDSFGTLDNYVIVDEGTFKEYFRTQLFDIHTAQHQVLTGILRGKWYENINQNSTMSLNVEHIAIDDDIGNFVRKSKQQVYAAKTFVQGLFKDIINEIETLCKQNYLMTASHARELLFYMHKQYTTKQSGENVTLETKTYQKVGVYVSRVASNIFVKHNKNQLQELRANYESYKRQQMVLFETCLAIRKSEDTVAEIITEVIFSHVKSETVDQLSREILNTLHGKLPRNKHRLIIDMCIELVDAKDFNRIISYILCPYETAQKWLQDKSNSILFEDNSKRFSECSQRVIDNLVLKVKYSLKSLIGTGDEMITTNDLVNKLHLNLNSNGIFVRKTDFGTVQSYHQVTTINLKAVCNAVDTKLERSITKLKQLFLSYTKDDTDWWKEKSPIQTIFERIWGCSKSCPYCNEPCEKSTESHTEPHTCVQHRPQCCNGRRFIGSEQAYLNTCNYSIHAGISHRCRVFKYKCNAYNRACKQEMHNYRDYRKFLKDWWIQPSSDMRKSSTFWLWFIGRFKEDLAERFNFGIKHIPDEWSQISPDDAKESLRTTYI